MSDSIELVDAVLPESSFLLEKTVSEVVVDSESLCHNNFLNASMRISVPNVVGRLALTVKKLIHLHYVYQIAGLG